MASVNALKADLTKLADEMTRALAEARAVSEEAQLFSEEMNLVERRQSWLLAVRDSDEEALSEKINQALAPSEGVKVKDGATVTDSKDLSALSRAGPCCGWENLKPITHLENYAPKFKTCTSQEDISQKIEAIAPVKKLIGVLMSSCKTAVNDLGGARKKHQQQKEKAKEKAMKEAAAKKWGHPSGGVVLFFLFCLLKFWA